jgi:hypothetical protein
MGHRTFAVLAALTLVVLAVVACVLIEVLRPAFGAG